MDIKILEANYRKLWLKERIDSPFRYATGLIREKWNLPYKGGRKKAKENVDIFYRILDKTNSWNLFLKDVNSFAEEFGFEYFWVPYLALYLITAEKYAPFEQKSETVPPKGMVKYEKMFAWKIKKEMQWEKLRKKGIKGRRSSKKDVVSNTDITYIDDIYDIKEYIPAELDSLIHNYQDVADKVFGEYGDTPLAAEDIKRISKVKTGIKSFKEELVPLTSQYRKWLTKLFA